MNWHTVLIWSIGIVSGVLAGLTFIGAYMFGDEIRQAWRVDRSLREHLKGEERDRWGGGTRW